MNRFGTSDGLSQSESEVLTTLTSHGGFAFKPGYSEFVIHTHSVPLASAVDLHYLKTEGVRSLFHGYAAGNKGDECPKRACMYVTKRGSRTVETVPSNCPCKDLQGPDGGPLKPRCFLAYTRSLGRLLVTEHEELEYMDPSRIMFCQTHTSLFDNKYPGWFRDELNVTGWQHVTEDYLVASLNALYWYRTYSKTLRLDNLIAQQLDKLGLRRVRHAITQAIHTINGVIIKKFMAFCPESIRYQDYAKQTAYLFRDLFSDYTHPLEFSSGELVEPQGLTYSELKDFLNTVKESFHGASYERRKKWLEYDFKSKSLRRMFSEIGRIKSLAESKLQSGEDYTESPSWIFRCTTLCQTRVLGYLPDCIAEVKRRQFRKNISRPREMPPPENLRLIKIAVEDELSRSKIPRSFMEESVHTDPASRDRFNEAMSAIELPLKGAASVDKFVREGGKIEDARLIINMAIDNKWNIPIRDLHDHEVVDTFTIQPGDGSTASDYVRPLFWISYTVILNWFVKKGYCNVELYYPLLDRDEEYLPDPMRASIVHISEPGKERNLTKSTGFLAWFLTPASKITQDTLAELPEHAAGLTSSGHEWRHQKRISSLSDESHFMYDIRTGRINPRIIQSFKDWTESTDFIGKLIGWAHLSSLFEFIAFPEGYATLIAHAILEPQPVREVVSLKNLDEDLEYEPVTWTGFINEGFMMGNPMTKTILHLIHVSERAVTRGILERVGIQEGSRGPYRGLGDPVKMDRKVTTGKQPAVRIRG
nr:putative RNA-dependent RNA polymerase [Leptosphaeria biglobosa narnavirus 11]